MALLITGLLLCQIVHAAAPVSVILSNRYPVDFSGLPVVRIQKGDRFEYTNVNYPDADWPVVSLPSSWDPAVYPGYRGVCWYRIRIRFPRELPRRALGIKLGEIFLADEAYFNGTLIGRTGDFQNLVVSRHNMDRIYEIPTPLVIPGADNVLALRVQGYIPGESGPLGGDFAVGDYGDLLRGFLFREFLKIVFVIFYTVIGVYFLIFFSRRPQDREHLFFGLFSLTFALYYFLRNDLRYYLLDLPYLQMEYSALILMFPLFMSFVLSYYRRRHGIVQKIFYASSLASVAVIFATRDPQVWKMLNIWFVQWTWIIPVVTVFALLIREFPANRDARLMVYAFSILVLFILHDILFYRAIIRNIVAVKYGFLSQYALVVFVTFIAMILSDKFVRLNRQVETLNRDLRENYRRIADINVELENKVRERTAELERINRTLEISAKTDVLTGLSNRKEMETRLQEEIVRTGRYRDKPGQSLSVLFLDLDHFKHYNDSFGHAVGDMILRKFAALLRETARQVDQISRFGGDEFIVVLVSTDEREAAVLADRIRERLLEQDNFLTDIRAHLNADINISPDHRLSCSIGISHYRSGSGLNYSQVIKQADRALYQAKNLGRNRTVVWGG